MLYRFNQIQNLRLLHENLDFFPELIKTVKEAQWKKNIFPTVTRTEGGGGLVYPKNNVGLKIVLKIDVA